MSVRHRLASMNLQIRGREVTETETVPGMPSLAAAALVVAALVAGYAALLTTAAVPSVVGFAVSSVAVTAVEIFADRREPIVPWALRRIEFGGVARGIARGLAVVVFASRSTPAATFVATLMVVAVISVAGVARVSGAQVHEFVRVPAAISRNLPLPIPPPPPPPPELIVRPGATAAVVEAIAAVGLALSVHAGVALGYASLGAAVLLALVSPIAIGADLLRLGGPGFRRRWTRAVGRAVEDYRPAVVVYLGNGAEWLYQLEMWLDVLESLPQRVMIVVRDVEALRSLAPSTVPVVCVPRAVALMQLPLPAPKAVLYVGNAANNAHFLRRLGTRTVFIGHGDSDKAASSNPFTRVYDEVWVAGEAGRDRYRRAGVDIADRAFVQVGRPQLPELPRVRDDVPMFTVLYAPTWEGWGQDDADSSVAVSGLKLIDALLGTPGVRVMYRPHPQTGYRDTAVRRAHGAILERMRAAGAQSAPAHDAPEESATATRPADLLTAVNPDGAGQSRARHDAALRQWTARYWAQTPGHRILTQPAPSLHACFSTTDLLIADISSVVADWLATDRPYAIVNLTDLPAAEFRHHSRTASGGFVLSPDLAGLAGILTAARTGNDPTSADRAAARTYLLGPRTADPAETFRRNIDRLCNDAQDGTDRSAAGRVG
jgi:hypothetical protein